MCIYLNIISRQNTIDVTVDCIKNSGAFLVFTKIIDVDCSLNTISIIL